MTRRIGTQQQLTLLCSLFLFLHHAVFPVVVAISPSSALPSEDEVKDGADTTPKLSTRSTGAGIFGFKPGVDIAKADEDVERPASFLKQPLRSKVAAGKESSTSSLREEDAGDASAAPSSVMASE